MNNIYKVIWSKAKNCYVVASEIARSHTKSATGSEKIGGVTRRSLLASLMALSLLCGGLGVASAADSTVHVDASTTPGNATEVYTTTGVNTLLADYGKKSDVENNKNSITTMNTTITTQGQSIATNVANIVNNTKAIEKKIDTEAADLKYATKEALEDKADQTTVTALDGRVGDVKGKVAALETKVGDASSGLVKDVADLNTELGKKADQTDLGAANQKITDLQKKTEKLSADGTELKGMTTVSGTNVEADVLTVKEKISNGAGVNTTLTAIDASMKQTVTNKADIAALQNKTDGQQTAINGLNEKTTKIGYDTATDTTSVNGMKVGQQVDMGGKDIINARALTATGKVTGDGVDAGTGAITGGSLTVTGKVTGNGVDAGAGDITTRGKVKGDTLETTGNATIGGALKATGKVTGDGVEAGTGAITGGSLTVTGKVTGNGVDAGAGAITGGSLSVTGDTSLKKTDVDGALTVTGASDLQGDVILGKDAANTVTVNGTANFNAPVNMANGLNVTNGETKLRDTTVTGDLNVTGTITTDTMVFGVKPTNYTEIDQGKVTSTNLEVRAGEMISSSSTFDVEKNEVGFGNGITDEQSSHKQTSDVITDTVKNNNTGDQSFHKQTSDVIMDNVKDGKNSNNRTQTKTETKDIITDENDNSSTTSQTASQNKTYLTDKDGKNTNSTIDTAKEYDKTIKGENGKTSTKQTATDITNTAKAGTIKNTAKNVTNTGTNSVTNKVGENEVKVSTSGVDIKADENGTIKESVGDNVNREMDKDHIKDSIGTSTSREITDGKITDTAGDATVTTEKGKGTTFGKDGSTGTTNIYGDTITTGTVDADTIKANETTTGKLTAGVGENENGARLTVNDDGVKGSYKSGDYTSKSYILKNTLKSGVDNGTGTDDNYTIGSRTDHSITDDGQAKLDETVKDANGSNVTNKTSTSTTTTIKDVTTGNTTSSEMTSTTITNKAADTIKDKAGDYTVTTDKDNGTTFGKEGSTKTTNIKEDNVTTGTIKATDTITGTLTAGVGEMEEGSRLTVDDNGVKGSVKSDKYTSKSYILKDTLQSGVDNGKDITDNGFVGSRTDHYMDGDKAKLNETVKDADGSNVTKKTSTKTYTEIKDTNGNTLSVNQKADGNNYKLEDQDGNTNHVTNSATQSKQTLKDKAGNMLTTNQTATKNNFDLKSADGSKENHTTNTVDESRVAIKGENGKAELSTTDEGTTFKHSAAKEAFTEGGATNTTIKGNTITTGKVTMDYADVMKDLGVYGNATVDKDMTVKGNTTLGEAGKDTTLTVNSKATFNENATFEKGAEVKNGLTVSSGGLNVTGESTFNDKVTMKNGLDVTGGVASDSFTVKGTDIKIDSSGINAGGTVISNVADGSISEGSKDAVNGGQLYQVKNDLEGKVNKVGANAAAMANLHPMEFDPDSKWNIAAAMGNYGSETATAIGAFYRPNEDVMVNFSTAFGTGENMVGGGVSVRLGKGSNKLSREESNALKDQVNDLTARMDALLSVLNPNMSKDFPDVPENHWAYEAVSRLAGNDIVQGYPDGEFHGERTMTRYEMAEIIYNALSRGAEAEKELVEEFKPELQAMAASEKATAERAEG